MGQVSDIEGQVFLLTGGAGGISRSIAEVFRDAGAKIVLTDVDEDALAERADELDVMYKQADLAELEAAEELVDWTTREAGGLDGVICTAGGFDFAYLTDTRIASFERMMNLNLRTLYTTVRSVVPFFAEQGRGFIAGFSAGPGFNRGVGGMALYSAAKAGVSAFLQAVDEEVSEQGIRVSIIYPMGVVATPANKKAMPDEDQSRWIEPASIGKTLVLAASTSSGARTLELPVYPPVG